MRKYGIGKSRPYSWTDGDGDHMVAREASFLVLAVLLRDVNPSRRYYHDDIASPALSRRKTGALLVFRAGPLPKVINGITVRTTSAGFRRSVVRLWLIFPGTSVSVCTTPGTTLVMWTLSAFLNPYTPGNRTEKWENFSLLSLLRGCRVEWFINVVQRKWRSIGNVRGTLFLW